MSFSGKDNSTVSDCASTRDDEQSCGLPESISSLGYEDTYVRQPWSTCSASRRPHDPDKLMLTALLPYGSLQCLWHRLHRIVRDLHCKCRHQTSLRHKDVSPAISTAASPASSTDTSAATSLDLLAELALKRNSSEEEMDELSEAPLSPSAQQPQAVSSVLYLPSPDDPGNLTAFKVRSCQSHEQGLADICILENLESLRFQRDGLKPIQHKLNS